MASEPDSRKKQASREILRLAIPAVSEQILLTIVLIVSTAIVSHLGEDYLLATAWNGNLTNIIMTAFVGLATGTTVVVSRAYGHKNISVVKSVFTISTVLGTLLGFAIGALGFFFADAFFNTLYGGAEASILPQAILYAKMTMPFMGFMAGELIIVGAIRGAGNNKAPFFFSIIINLVNVVVSYMLVNGFYAPALGFAGAAIGINTARVVGFACALIYALGFNEHLKGSFKSFKSRHLILVRRILNVGLPAATEQVLTHIGFLILGVLLITLGKPVQAGFNISGNANSIVWAPMTGVAVTMTALISRYLGANDPDYCDILIKQSMKMSWVILVASTLCEFIFAPQIVSFYSSEATSPETIESAVLGLRCFGALACVFGFSTLEAGILKGAGAVMYVAVTMFISLWLFRVLLVWILIHVMHLGLPFLFIAISFDFTSRALLYWFKIKKGDWKRIRI